MEDSHTEKRSRVGSGWRPPEAACTLVATCPCALSLATPTALTAATGTLHKLGLLVTRGHVLEGLNQIDTVIFDKTGTLTEGRLTLRSIRPLGAVAADRCLALFAKEANNNQNVTREQLTADKALYRAKAAGRNQVVIGTAA